MSTEINFNKDIDQVEKNVDYNLKFGISADNDEKTTLNLDREIMNTFENGKTYRFSNPSSDLIKNVNTIILK
ncbi:hypothetical protein D3C81_760830 [compost metagenome]